ncbi:cation:proton antiporter [Chroococcidiopsis thermalis]|jgi:Kef-type K+ transport system membrane component KefB/nucleotide-binding universal stress UspA family protein|uniref:Transporter, CPA2 family n=1 Tax=Chroococcidiopsis thermalis (strain PCC 7203) TaxID=251229 RepID=K9U042_CHRTP|nr:cation:proton antiporter [Chroococcidiopsis thermalis]AFY88205.1 transporter, CPA2 family [Chroococcidiopsis thermalis PCC 7203]
MTNFWQQLQMWGDRAREFLTPSVFAGPITDPVPVFLTIMAIMLVAPLLFERVRLPGIVGLILAGVVVGPYGIGVLERDSTIILLGTVGLLFLMFMAGLETSLDDLKYNADKAVIFGIATFIVPMALGTVAMLAIGYGFLAAILVASCFASHTLLALPVATKLGIMRTQAVTATLGATLITNVLALLVLAVVVQAHQGSLSLGFWLFLIPALTIYTFATLWGVPKIGRWFFRRFGHDEGAEFTFVVATLFVVSYAAELIDIEPIVGAFLAGIAITQLIPQLSPLMNRIQFIGNTLFVPFFLISVGMLINPRLLVSDPRSLLVAGVMIVVALVAKFVPAWGSGKLFGFQSSGIMVMFGLSVAQAASTLAAITVAFQIQLVDQATVNGTVAMILVTCIASPWVTSRWGQGVKVEAANPTSKGRTKQVQQGFTAAQNLRVLVPVANPSTEDNLLHLALILTKKTAGTLLPLHILPDKQGTIAPEAKIQQSQLLATAETIAHAAVTAVEPIGRIDDSVDKGILRSALERDANLIVCGWKGFSTYRENFFGSAIDNVIRRATVPVLIARFAQPIENTHRVFLAIADIEKSASTFGQTVSLAKSLADELKASLQLLQVTASPRKRTSFNPEELGLSPDTQIQQVRGNFIGRVSKMLQQDDLLILTAGTHPDIRGLPALGVAPEAIARSHPEVSIIVIHFPQRI